MIQFSIIILNYNGANFLEECIYSIENQIDTEKGSFEIIIADNNSKDNSVELLKTKFFSKRLLIFQKNHGYAKGNNLAAKYAKGKYLIFLNVDTIVEKKFLNTLDKLIKDSIMKYGNDKSIYGPSIYYNYAQNILLSKGGSITLFGTGFDYGFGNIEKINQFQFNEVGFICGACLIIPRDFFFELNGFDSDYFCYNEDVDLCWRAWLLGNRCLYFPQLSIEHFFSGSQTGSPESRDIKSLQDKINKNLNSNMFKIQYAQKNRLSTIIKNFSFNYVVISIFISSIYDLMRIFRYLFEKKIFLVLSLLKGYFNFIKELKYLIKKRLIIQNSRKVKDSFLFNNRVISNLQNMFVEFIRVKTNRVLI